MLAEQRFESICIFLFYRPPVPPNSVQRDEPVPPHVGHVIFSGTSGSCAGAAASSVLFPLSLLPESPVSSLAPSIISSGSAVSSSWPSPSTLSFISCRRLSSGGLPLQAVKSNTAASSTFYDRPGHVHVRTRILPPRTRADCMQRSMAFRRIRTWPPYIRVAFLPRFRHIRRHHC